MSAHGYTRHARGKMRDLGLSVSDVNAIVTAGDVIEQYRVRRGALLYGRIGDREFHVSLVHDPSSGVTLVTTVYEVDRGTFPNGRRRRQP